MGTKVRVIASQGVAFDVELDGEVIHALASSDYLERRFGSVDDARSWLATYHRYAAEIDADVRFAAFERDRRVVVLTEAVMQSDTMPAMLSRL